MPEFQVGELVDITIRTARVVNTYPSRVDGEWAGQTLLVEYREGQRRSLAVNLDAPNVTVTRVAPAEWPPQPGDLWRSAPCSGAPSGELWLACDEQDDDGTSDPYVPLMSGGGARYYDGADLLRERGPMKLLHREPTACAESNGEQE